MESALRRFHDAVFHLGVHAAQLSRLLEGNRIRPEQLVPVLHFGAGKVLPEIRMEQEVLLPAMRASPDAAGEERAEHAEERHQAIMNGLVALRHFMETKQDFHPALTSYAQAIRGHTHLLDADTNWLESRMDDEGHERLRRKVLEADATMKP